MSVEATIRDYYEALRRGEPLAPYFRETDDAWKGAISTEYAGHEAIAEALREQTRTTEDWTVDSEALRVHEGDGYARFDDRVELAWTDARSDQRHRFETRWSGVLEPDGGEWLFVQLHVSARRQL